MSPVRPVLERDWHVDHVIPLWRVGPDRSLNTRDRYWGLVNLQTLCAVHHRAKTGREAAERAATRREAARRMAGGEEEEGRPVVPDLSSFRSIA